MASKACQKIVPCMEGSLNLHVGYFRSICRQEENPSADNSKIEFENKVPKLLNCFAPEYTKEM